MQRKLVAAEPNNYQPRLSPALMAQSSKVKQVRMRNPERIREGWQSCQRLTRAQTNKHAHKKNIIISSLRGQNREKIFSVYVCSHGINENLLKRFNLLLLEQDGFAFWNFPSHKAIVWLHKTRRIVHKSYALFLKCFYCAFFVLFGALSAPVLIHVHS